jgi:magnesium transporter
VQHREDDVERTVEGAATIAGSGYIFMGAPIADHWWYPWMLIVTTTIATLVSFLWVWHVWRKKDDIIRK